MSFHYSSPLQLGRYMNSNGTAKITVIFLCQERNTQSTTAYNMREKNVIKGGGVKYYKPWPISHLKEYLRGYFFVIKGNSKSNDRFDEK